eukprot:gene14773-biopygen6611
MICAPGARAPGTENIHVGAGSSLTFQRLSRDTSSSIFGVRFTLFAFLSRMGAKDLKMPVFAPRSEPPHAHAPGAQIMRMASGSSLAFQRLSRDTPNCILSVRLAETSSPAQV